ncbi:MAG: GntR family transcriptional regulator [Candidatus Fimivivens sp.]
MSTIEVHLDHNSIIPLYMQVSACIKNEIMSGCFSETLRLPTEDKLSEQYNVSRITVRRAVNELVGLGLVQKKQGKGTFVSEPKPQKNFSANAISFTQMCAKNGCLAGTKLIKSSLCVPEMAWVREKLELAPNQQAVRIQRLRYANGVPIVLEDSFYLCEYACLLDMDLEQDSTYRFLREEKGIDMYSKQMSLRIVRADSKIAKLLAVPRYTPQLQMTGLVTQLDGTPIHTSFQIGYGERFDFIVR